MKCIFLVAVLSTALMKEEDQSILQWSNATENAGPREMHSISQFIIKILHNNMVSTMSLCLILCKATLIPVSTVLLSTLTREKKGRHTGYKCYSTKTQKENIIEAC